jgi:dihydropteroate synthase
VTPDKITFTVFMWRPPQPVDEIDTMKPAVARACLEAGASLVNDVGAGGEHPEMWRAVADSGAGYVLMHIQGTPQTMQKNPVYQDVVREVEEFFSRRLGQLNSLGIATEQIILDVGLGFGKTLEHNMLLLGALDAFKKWGRPMLLGASRKSFVGQLTGAAELVARLPGSLACACWGIEHGVNIVRTHDVAATRQAIRMTEAILARKK